MLLICVNRLFGSCRTFHPDRFKQQTFDLGRRTRSRLNPAFQHPGRKAFDLDAQRSRFIAQIDINALKRVAGSIPLAEPGIRPHFGGAWTVHFQLLHSKRQQQLMPGSPTHDADRGGLQGCIQHAGVQHIGIPRFDDRSRKNQLRQDLPLPCVQALNPLKTRTKGDPQTSCILVKIGGRQLSGLAASQQFM
ncbi:hypothetical protein D3C72_1025100 [compost metagenome]